MSTSYTTMVDALLLRYIPKRVQRSSSFHRDTKGAAPAPRRRVKHLVKLTEEGSPVQHLGKRGGHVLLFDE